MIKYYYKNIRAASIKQLDEPQRGSWAHVESPTPEDIEELTKRFKFDEDIIKDALDDDEQPRIEREGEKCYIFVRYAYQRPDGDLDTAPLLIMFDAQVLVTVSLQPVPAVDRMLSGRDAFSTTQRTKLIIQILAQISDQYDVFISQTTRKIKAIRSRLRGQGITNQDFIDFATIEDELNEFMSSLLPTNATLRRLLAAGYLPMFEADQDLVEDLLLNNEQSIEASKSNLRSIENIRDAYSAISANNLNRIITWLTVATVLVALPNVFFGFYGMNVDLPFQSAHYAFAFIGGFSALLIISIIYLVRKKRII